MGDVVENLVSTIIPVFNRPRMLQAAVESVLAQTFRPIEVIIADDGSTDRTPDVAAELVRAHEGVVFYTRHDNAGPGPARELGRRIARGEFIQYLDSDDRLLPNKFTDQVRALRDNPACDIAYGVTRLVDHSGQILADPFKWTDKNIDTLFPGLLVDRWWCTHTPLYRRSLTDRIGPWCDMRWSQDWEYDSRIGALGTKLIHCGTVVSEHVHHDGERQTGHAKWTTDPVRLRNRVQLLTVLWRDAQAAGVPASAPERQHFARWCFSIARQCAAQGLVSEVHQLLDIAQSAACGGPGARGLRLFRLACRGSVTLAGRFSRRLERMRSSRGSASVSQSFEGQIEG